MSYVTYLIGAGASYNALPLNEALITRMNAMITIGKNHPENELNQTYLKTFENTFKPIIELAKKEKSIDTLANIHLNSSIFYDIKTLIWLYFSSVAGKGNLDNRYKNLLVKMRDNSASNFRIRDGFSFLSWNYDLQIEEAISEIGGTEIWRVADRFYTYPGLEFTSPEKIGRNSNPKYFSIVHLNGCAGYYYDVAGNTYREWYNCDIANSRDYDKLLHIVAQNFYTNLHINKSKRSSIAFAFEDAHYNKQSLIHTKEIAAASTHLVVIGYSFPDFNREIDRRILNEMKNLKYICIQDPNAEKLKHKLMSQSENVKDKVKKGAIDFYIENDLSEFHFPFDL